MLPGHMGQLTPSPLLSLAFAADDGGLDPEGGSARHAFPRRYRFRSGSGNFSMA